jgi:hypothetical protein
VLLGEWKEAAAVVDAVLTVVEQREDMKDWQTVTIVVPLLRAKALIQVRLTEGSHSSFQLIDSA